MTKPKLKQCCWELGRRERHEGYKVEYTGLDIDWLLELLSGKNK